MATSRDDRASCAMGGANGTERTTSAECNWERGVVEKSRLIFESAS